MLVADRGGFMPLLLSILLLSAAALAYELLLMRLFSIIQWQHFAAMVISLALLGHGASGTLIALFRRALLRRFRIAYVSGALLLGVGTVGTFGLAQRIPFNPLELAWDPRQLAALAGLYLVLSVPFFGAAGAIGLALVRFEAKIDRIYRADLIGAGIGAAGVMALLSMAHPTRCLEWIGALACGAAGLALWDRSLGRRRLLGTGLVGVALLTPLLWPPAWTALQISPYKGLPQTLQSPGARVVTELSSPLGLLTVVESSRIPLRHAPGLSLAYTSPLPDQLGLFTDGDALSAITRFDGDRAPIAYRDYLTSAAPYHLLRQRGSERPRVLVLGPGGGGAVLTALYHRAASLDAVEADSRMIELVTEEFAQFAGGPYGRSDFHLRQAAARSFLARSPRRWDLIQIPAGGSAAAASGGTHGLAENHLFTVEALEQIYRHLAPDGMASFDLWMAVPPRQSLKLVATAAAALEREGVKRPGTRLAMIRGWRTATLIVKRGRLQQGELEALRRFCRGRSFDLAWYPGMAASEANRFNLLPEPYLYDGAVALLGPARDRYMGRYKFHLEPATDNRPFFSRSFRWRTLSELIRLRERGGTPLISWGYLVLIATVVQAAAAGLLLVLLPVLVARRRDVRRRGALPIGLYFLFLGLAFLFIEIVLIQTLTLFLGHPLYAIAVVLGSFLVCAGMGSGLAHRCVESWRQRGPGWLRLPAWALPAAAVALVAALTAVLLPHLEPLMGLPDPVRFGVAVLLMAPLAFLMGMPFPLGLARVAQRHSGWVAWAWAVNGCASVVSAVAATLLAVHAGFTVVMLAAAGLYAAAAVVARRIG